MLHENVIVSSGRRLVISGTRGNVRPHTVHGLYAVDTRFLSDMHLVIDQRDPEPLGIDQADPALASFYLTASSQPETSSAEAGDLSVVRDRLVQKGFHEDVSVLNHGDATAEFELGLNFATDFAEVFAVRGLKALKTHPVELVNRPGQDITFQYRSNGAQAETWISLSEKARVEGSKVRFDLKLKPRATWKTCVQVLPVVAGEVPEMDCVSKYVPDPFAPFHRGGPPGGTHPAVAAIQPLFPDPPRITSDRPAIAEVYAQALYDIRQLTIEPTLGVPVIAAGLPWYMAVFGRDSILTSLETKMLGPKLMVNTLRTLAPMQAAETDPSIGAEPGKLPHEVRRGDAVSAGKGPSRTYFTVDATPLFAMLFAEAFRWTGDTGLVKKFLPNAEAAITWCDRYGDVDGDGFIEWPKFTDPAIGFPNQSWKDSEDSTNFADGRLAVGPVAIAEAQAYVYGAKRGMAEVYARIGRTDDAERLENEAAVLKARFNEKFWMPERKFYAEALDGEKQQVDSITSNPGHALWTGIVDDDHAKDTVATLLSEEMYTGWGIRTLASTMGRYNPESYHNGSVWPHDTAIVAAGMARYGFNDEAREVVMALLSAASVLDNRRLPEVFAGFARRQNSIPVPYPAANAPQAWACGAVILSMEVLMGLQVQGNRILRAGQTDELAIDLKGIEFQGRKFNF